MVNGVLPVQFGQLGQLNSIGAILPLETLINQNFAPGLNPIQLALASEINPNLDNFIDDFGDLGLTGLANPAFLNVGGLQQLGRIRRFRNFIRSKSIKKN